MTPSARSCRKRGAGGSSFAYLEERAVVEAHVTHLLPEEDDHDFVAGDEDVEPFVGYLSLVSGETVEESDRYISNVVKPSHQTSSQGLSRPVRSVRRAAACGRLPTSWAAWCIRERRQLRRFAGTLPPSSPGQLGVAGSASCTGAAKSSTGVAANGTTGTEGEVRILLRRIVRRGSRFRRPWCWPQPSAPPPRGQHKRRMPNPTRSSTMAPPLTPPFTIRSTTTTRSCAWASVGAPRRRTRPQRGHQPGVVPCPLDRDQQIGARLRPVRRRGTGPGLVRTTGHGDRR